MNDFTPSPGAYTSSAVRVERVREAAPVVGVLSTAAPGAPIRLTGLSKAKQADILARWEAGATVDAVCDALVLYRIEVRTVLRNHGYDPKRTQVERRHAVYLERGRQIHALRSSGMIWDDICISLGHPPTNRPNFCKTLRDYCNETGATYPGRPRRTR